MSIAPRWWNVSFLGGQKYNSAISSCPLEKFRGKNWLNFLIVWFLFNIPRFKGEIEKIHIVYYNCLKLYYMSMLKLK